MSTIFISLIASACSTPYQQSVREFGMERADLLAYRIDQARQVQLKVPRAFARAIRVFETAANADPMHRAGTVSRFEARYYDADEAVWSARKSLASITDVWRQLRDEHRTSGTTSEPAVRELERDYQTLFTKLNDADRTLHTNFQQFTDALTWLRSADSDNAHTGEWITRLTVAREQTLSTINRTLASMDTFHAQLNATGAESRTASVTDH